MDETLTTEQVRAAVVGAGFSAEDFDDWLEEHDRKVEQQGWNDGVDWTEQYGSMSDD